MVTSASATDMLSSLLRPRKESRRRHDSPMFDSNPNTPSPGPDRNPITRRASLGPEPRHATADFTEADDDDEESDEAADHVEDGEEDDEEEGLGELPRFTRYRHGDMGMHDADRRRSSNTVIPLFSASHLDSLPIYSIVHAIRIIVQTRTETSLTWDQLRSPQVSQFLIKPMQQQIRTQHFTRATLYALMANCFQFAKEGQLYPGNAGTSSTRAKVCELLALKLLKEYGTRELIDALSYDFYPLQGLPDGAAVPNRGYDNRNRPAVARTSTLEVAIRASAKNFLAHPLVVQQLEAIWNGAISFYSSADHLHRAPEPQADASLKSAKRGSVDARTPLLNFQPPQEELNRLPLHAVPIRRTVTLYDPRNASLFKLSRLRVPRYRQFLSTCSLFILICLFLAVLIERSNRITTLELVFWFWSAGFMLDEVVGFNEQGFSLYIMSFWNVFDLGILLILVVYYGMRIYGVFLVDAHLWNDMAYDVLAANAILLLPRIFSVLDHYQYFSQLLIAFRLMAVDLVAVFILILISCSGFFVFFTLSRNNNDASEVAYAIFQIVMGFTPAAWDVWPQYNFLGKMLLSFFLIICHFVIVTILITVLTNSFIAIASNANQEHQFLFAINTISMVKNDSLFSYIAPGNILAWMLMPLRYAMPLREFVGLNRLVIKLTHFPLLFCIFVYEKYILASDLYEPTDLVENPGRTRARAISFADPASRAALFSPNIRAREESGVGLQKDRALDEVFRRAPDTLRQQRNHERRKSQTAIRNWMDQNDDEEEEGEPLTHWPTVNSRLSGGSRFGGRFRHISDVRSAASDPADLISNSGFQHGGYGSMRQQQEYKDHTDAEADGDDELVTNDDDDEDNAETQDQGSETEQEEDYFTTPVVARFGTLAPSSVSSRNSMASARRQGQGAFSPRSGAPRRQGMHSRTMSTNTILYAPQEVAARKVTSPSSASEQQVSSQSRSRPKSSRLNTVETPGQRSPKAGQRSPKRSIYNANNINNQSVQRPRPIPSQTAPNRASLLGLTGPRAATRLSSVDLDFNSDMGLDVDAANVFGAVPSSFQTQMALATGQLKGLGRGHLDRESADRMTRLMLARMKTLEEGFNEVVKEMRNTRSGIPTAQNSGEEGGSSGRSGLHGTSENSGGIIARRGNNNKLLVAATAANTNNNKRPKTGRPASIKEEKLPARPKSKGNKGKEVAHSSEDESEVPPRRALRRGSSF
ncbi:Calcium channel YVC1 [Apiospora arundinis]|uniref:Calcium channel YVC1 n=1 Tax=Apiospora arundinis TaxID=335852 RepID=A0ABR2IT72_9PEZI